MLGAVMLGQSDVDVYGLPVKAAAGLLVAAVIGGAQHEEMAALGRPLEPAAARGVRDPEQTAYRFVRDPLERRLFRVGSTVCANRIPARPTLPCHPRPLGNSESTA